MLTRKQYELLVFVNRHLHEHGVSPSFDEMKAALGLRSKSGIHRLITGLEERGFIRRLAHRARALEVTRLPENHAGAASRSMAPAGTVAGFRPNVIQGDFREEAVLRQLEAVLAGRAVDVVVSDMAPNLSGIESSDSARIAHLVELAVEFAQNHLKPQGALVCKVFHGSGYSQLVKLFKERFRVVKPIKPKASRDKSAETFLVGLGLKSASVAP